VLILQTFDRNVKLLSSANVRLRVNGGMKVFEFPGSAECPIMTLSDLHQASSPVLEL
jgi:hypothetical protein